MAQFTFYAVANDIEGIFRSLSERGDLKFTPARSYPANEYITLSSVKTQEERSLSQNRQWFISGVFTERPLFISKVAEKHYSIQVAYDGPALLFTVPPIHRMKEGLFELVPGSLFYPQEYWDGMVTKSQKPSQELKAAYASIVSTIKRHLVRRRVDHWVWIGKYADALLESRKAIILSGGKWLNGKGRIIKVNSTREK